MADDEEELKPFWLNVECRGNLDPDWDPTMSLVMDEETSGLFSCEECPCVPCPWCPSCDETWAGPGKGNYFELWGIPCGEDCDTATPQLIGVYNTMWAYEKYGWVGCYWSEFLEDDPPSCRTWLGVDPQCGFIIIGREQLCVEDPCRARMLEIVKECSHHGYWHDRGTGWLYRTDDLSNMTPVIFTWVSWYRSETTGKYKGWLRALDCNCYEMLIATAENLTEQPRSPEVFGYKFLAASSACDDDNCQAKITAFLELANQNGWPVRGEGITASRAMCWGDDNHVFGDWYVYSGSRYLMCADAGDQFYMLGCRCSIIQVPKRYLPNSPADPATNPGDYTIYIEYPNACECVDTRELYLTYPDVFGILDISYGNHSKYQYTYTEPVWDPETGEPTGETITRSAYGICDNPAHTLAACCQGQQGGIRTLANNYIDYRSFCYVQKVFDSDCQQKVRIGRLDPQGSRVAGSWSGAGPYDSAEFVGHLVPFTRDPDIMPWDNGFSFEGQIYQWTWSSSSGTGGGDAWTQCFQSQTERDSVCAYTPPQPTDLQFCDVAHGMPGYAPRVSPPDTTATLVPCRTWEETDQWGQPSYCAINAHWEVGRQVGEDQWIVYREQYIETSKGWLRYGVPGYAGSFTLYGIQGAPPCDPESDPECWYDSACYDRVMVAHVDEDMHGCNPDIDWGFDEEQEEE